VTSNPPCPECLTPVEVTNARSRIKHNADGTHTVTPAARPRKATDPKPRGRPRAAG